MHIFKRLVFLPRCFSRFHVVHGLAQCDRKEVKLLILETRSMEPPQLLHYPNHEENGNCS